MPTTYALKGVNFDDQEYSPSSDCALWHRLVKNGIIQGMTISASGSGVRVTAGWIMAGGKQLQLPSTVTIPCTGATSGYARIVVNVDLSRTSTETVFEQGWLSVDYAATRSGFASLSTQDLAGSGTVYQMALCIVKLGSSGVSDIVYTCGSAHARGSAFALTLPASGWSNNRLTLDVSGITTTTHVICSYAPANRDACRNADVYLFSQAVGSLTFACSSVPAGDLVVNIILL